MTAVVSRESQNSAYWRGDVPDQWQEDDEQSDNSYLNTAYREALVANPGLIELQQLACAHVIDGEPDETTEDLIRGVVAVCPEIPPSYITAQVTT